MQCEFPLHCKQTGQQRKNVHAQALYSWLLVACIIDIFKLSFINTLAWYFKCFLPEVVKNSIFKNEIIESLRRQAVILICPVKTRRVVGQNTMSSVPTSHCVSGILPRGAPIPCCPPPKPPAVFTALCCKETEEARGKIHPSFLQLNELSLQ